MAEILRFVDLLRTFKTFKDFQFMFEKKLTSFNLTKFVSFTMSSLSDEEFQIACCSFVHFDCDIDLMFFENRLSDSKLYILFTEYLRINKINQIIDLYYISPNCFTAFVLNHPDEFKYYLHGRDRKVVDARKNTLCCFVQKWLDELIRPFCVYWDSNICSIINEYICFPWN